MKTFPTAGMDRTTILYSLLFVLICSGAVILLLSTDGDKQRALAVVTAVILVAAPIAAYLMIPRLAINDGKVVIKNTFVSISLPVVSMTNVERYTKVGFNMRIFGVGGVFGYFGYFNSNEVWYVTNIRRKVKITMKTGKIYMISPDNPDAFLTEIRKTKAAFS